MRQQRRMLPTGTTTTHSVDIQAEMGVTESDLKLFSKNLRIHSCSEYEQHKKEVIESLSSAFLVSHLEAEQYLYPTALTLVSSLAVRHARSARTISKVAFVDRLRPSRALFNAWALREKGEESFSRTIRRKHFSVRNIDAVRRFFVIETPTDATNTDLLGLVNTLRMKWSIAIASEESQTLSATLRTSTSVHCPMID